MSIDKIKEEIRNFDLPSYEMIPTIGLFLKQVEKYVTSYMEDLGLEGLTSSMISNYVKHHLIESPNKKQYSREQIATLLFIAVAKAVLSLEDIETMLLMQSKIATTEDAYEYFRKELISSLHYVFLLDKRNNDEDIDEGRMLLKNMVNAASYKVYIDKYLKERRKINE